MNSTSKLFFSAFVAKNNLVNLIFTIVFASATLAGVWLLATNQYQQIHENSLIFSAAIAIALVLTIIMAIRLSYQPFKVIGSSL